MTLRVQLCVAVLRTVESSLARVCSGVDIGFKFDEQLDNFVVSVVCGLHQCRLVVVRARVRVGALFQERLHGRDTARLGG
jgi:hypothetical protein